MTERAAANMSRRELYTLFGALMLTMLLASLDQTIVGTALPTIVGDLDGMGDYTWVVTAYLIATTASTPLYGKLSDLYGRRPVILTAIVIFLVASALAGLSQNMLQLILFRGLQGLGGGGLISLAFTVVSDVVSPRERGKYQGFFGAVFGVSSVAGPVLGGWLAEVDWRWIFYINLPLGFAAMIAVNQILRRHTFPTRQRKIDYLGATCLVPAVVCLLLAVTWGGSDYAWDSGVIVGLFAAAAALTVAFLYVETRAEEPILPLRMFKQGTLALAAVIALVFGVGMFSGIVYIPLFFQMVRGYSPTASGLLMIPMMAGMVLTSVSSGFVISRIGRYKWFLVAGSLVITGGLALFSRLHVDTPLWLSSLYLLVLGIGMGMFMQPLVLAMQNIVSVEDLGAGTSTNNFARSLGGAIGTAVLGAVMTSRLNDELAENLPEAVAQLPPEQAAAFGETDLSQVMESPTVVAHLPEPVRVVVQQAFTDGLDRVFLVAAGIAAVTIVLSLLMPNLTLRGAGPEHDPETKAAEIRAETTP
ncbi:MFS transporter [Glycomyces sp. TRM65418]|uniref:MDR family MFS transporter n=1 Tax=Glycomyces sp. TRM65418 TaxID=2867006 RepID=UPI001CE54161|nr:MDR family MFS transporter [Glycomyces sp. TRM65418]MCC3764368.1 MFS transporter [Glycomyces sp. TRM65418]QZD54047.1 MFS transporter [Glycomyces sp. TRM65418]